MVQKALSLKVQLVNLLAEQKEPCSARYLAEQLQARLEQPIEKKAVNQILYALLKLDEVRQIDSKNGGAPLWTLP